MRQHHSTLNDVVHERRFGVGAMFRKGTLEPDADWADMQIQTEVHTIVSVARTETVVGFR